MVLNYMQVIAIILFADSMFMLGLIIGYLIKRGDKEDDTNNKCS